MTPAPRNANSRLLVCGLFLVLIVVFTHPLAWRFATHHVGESAGDARIYVWNHWWVKTALLRLHTSPFQTDFIFYPIGIGLSLHTLALFHGLVFIPLSAAFGDVAASNLVVVATFLASALGAYALARHLGAGRHGAFLAGLVFAFCPYRLARLDGHYDLLSTEWLPIYALFFLKALEAERAWVAPVLVAGVLGAACGYTDLTYLVFLALLSLICLALIPGQGRFAPILRRGAGVALIAAGLLLPLLLAIRRDVTSWRYLPYPGADRYVADLLGYVTPGPRQTLLGPLLGRAFDPNVTEATVFVGWIPLALGLGALASRELRRSHRAWVVLGAIAFVLSLGNTLHVGGHDTGLALPFPLVQRLPLFHHLRAPCRFSILVVLCLALLSSAVWTRWLGTTTTTRRALLTAAAAALISAEFLAIPIPTFAAGAPAVFRRIAEEPGDFAVLEVPGVDQAPGQIMYRQTIHGKRILIGAAARVPVEKANYFYGIPLVRPLIDLRRQRLSLEAALGAEGREGAPEAARFLQVRYFVVDKAYEGRGIVRFLETALPVDRVAVDDERVVLRVRSEALPAVPWRLDAGAPASRLYFEAGWWPPKPDGGQAWREASGVRSTVLFRRPSGEPLDAVLVLSPPQGAGEVRAEGRIDGKRVGRSALGAISELRWPIPQGDAGSMVRLELRFSARGARIAGVRFERR